eukprot:196214-Lingulodinium_polyedra.AAC.1
MVSPRAARMWRVQRGVALHSARPEAPRKGPLSLAIRSTVVTRTTVVAPVAPQMPPHCARTRA